MSRRTCHLRKRLAVHRWLLFERGLPLLVFADGCSGGGAEGAGRSEASSFGSGATSCHQGIEEGQVLRVGDREAAEDVAVDPDAAGRQAPLLVGVATTRKPAGGHIAVVGAQLAGPRQGDGHRVAALGGYAVPVLTPADGHRVAHLGPLGVLQDAQVATHGQRERAEGGSTQAALEAGHQAPVVQLIAV